MKKNIFKISGILISLFSFFLIANFSLAGVGNLSDAFKVDDHRVGEERDIVDAAAFNAGYDVGRAADQQGATPERVVSLIINTVLGLLGVLFVILVIYGGILWMTAGGNEETVKKAQNIIKRAIVGLVIVLLAYMISIFIISIFVNTPLPE